MLLRCLVAGFLLAIPAGGAFASVPPLAKPETQTDPNVLSATTQAIGPFPGHIGHDRARIWFRAAQPGPVRAWLMPRGGDSHAITLVSGDARPERDLCVVFDFADLTPATEYLYTIAAELPLPDNPAWSRSFRTGPDPAAGSRVTLAFGSCCKDTPGEPLPVFEQMASARPDALVLIGDTPYIDSTELAIQRKRYREFFSNPQLSALRASTALYATWDDHDFGANDTDGRIADKKRSRRAFLEYHANAGADGLGASLEDGENGQGIYSRFRRGQVEVFLIDARWFSRTEQSPVDPLQPSLLGRQQWEWLRRDLKASTATFKVLATGMIWNESVRPLKTDHWGAYPHERAALWRYLSEEKIGGVVLMGGDIHRSRLLKHSAEFSGAPYPLYEFIVSPLHQSVHEVAKVPHPSLVWDAGDPEVFLLLEADTTVEPATLRARWINAGGSELHRVEIKADELCCRR